MKTFMLSLVFLVSVSFSGTATNVEKNKKDDGKQEKTENTTTTNALKQKQTTKMASFYGGCTNCADFADGAEHAGGNWENAFNHCQDNMTPCNEALEPVTVETDYPG